MPVSATRPPRPLRWLLAGAALLFPAALLGVAVLRVPYPFELEWLEGLSLHHVQRLLQGRPLYAPPSLEFISFDYTPLYFHVAAFASRLLGPGFAPLRVVSLLASLGSLGLVFALARR